VGGINARAHTVLPQAYESTRHLLRMAQTAAEWLKEGNKNIGKRLVVVAFICMPDCLLAVSRPCLISGRGWYMLTQESVGCIWRFPRQLCFLSQAGMCVVFSSPVKNIFCECMLHAADTPLRCMYACSGYAAQ